MTDSKVMELQNQQIKGVTLKIVYTIIASTVLITGTILTTLFNIRSEIQTDRESAKLRQKEVDAKFEKIDYTNEFKWNTFEIRLASVEAKNK